MDFDRMSREELIDFCQFMSEKLIELEKRTKKLSDDYERLVNQALNLIRIYRNLTGRYNN